MPEESYSIPLQSAEVKREGRDLTIVAYSIMVPRALEAAEKLAAEGIEIEVVDPRCLKPLDAATIVRSVSKTGRVLIAHEAPITGGFGGELAAVIAASEAFDYLDAPIRRVAGRRCPDSLQSDVGTRRRAAGRRYCRGGTLAGAGGKVAVATEVIMPKVDMVMETGTFVEWLKQEGDRVNKGDPLFIISTDKANIEIESPGDGVLTGLNAKINDVIPVTEVIAYILAPGEALPTKAAPQPVVAASAPSAGKAATAVDLAAAVVEAAESGKVRATPLARRIARELGVDLKQIVGHGPLGRIHKADVLSYQKPQPVVAHPIEPVAASGRVNGSAPRTVQTPVTPSASIPLPDARRKQVVPVTGARKIIAERMAYSAFTAPHINSVFTRGHD